ncbi:hypothetical protein ABVK25_012425 [Lepraria finkii]|uniref:Uncharacterized protein n=1 Tax=Lepraria finkii TaxID=1340010 RepID=A0ABR4AE94_9LECA
MRNAYSRLTFEHSTYVVFEGSDGELLGAIADAYGEVLKELNDEERTEALRAMKSAVLGYILRLQRRLRRSMEQVKSVSMSSKTMKPPGSLRTALPL